MKIPACFLKYQCNECESPLEKPQPQYVVRDSTVANYTSKKGEGIDAI